MELIARQPNESIQLTEAEMENEPAWKMSNNGNNGKDICFWINAIKYNFLNQVGPKVSNKSINSIILLNLHSIVNLDIPK